MAQIIDTETLPELVVNKVPSKAVFDDMVDQGQVNPDEMYLVVEDTKAEDVVYDPTETYTSGTVGAKLSELATDIGDMSNLDTTATNLVGAVNEVKGSLSAIGNIRFVSFNTSSITAQIDALGVGTFFGTVSNTTVGIPVASTGFVRVYASSANYKRVYYYNNSSTSAMYKLAKSGGTWQSTWSEYPLEVETGSVTNNIISGTVSLKKYGHVVTLQVESDATIIPTVKNYGTALFKLPEGYRPTANILWPCAYYLNASELTFTLARIQASTGNVAIMVTGNSEVSVGYIRLFVTYIVD